MTLYRNQMEVVSTGWSMCVSRALLGGYMNNPALQRTNWRGRVSSQRVGSEEMWGFELKSGSSFPAVFYTITLSFLSSRQLLLTIGIFIFWPFPNNVVSQLAQLFLNESTGHRYQDLKSLMGQNESIYYCNQCPNPLLSNKLLLKMFKTPLVLYTYSHSS